MDHRSYVVHRPHEATRGAEAFSSDARLQVPPGSAARNCGCSGFNLMLSLSSSTTRCARSKPYCRKPTIASQPRTSADNHARPQDGGTEQGQPVALAESRETPLATVNMHRCTHMSTCPLCSVPSASQDLLVSLPVLRYLRSQTLAHICRGTWWACTWSRRAAASSARCSATPSCAARPRCPGGSDCAACRACESPLQWSVDGTASTRREAGQTQTAVCT